MPDRENPGREGPAAAGNPAVEFDASRPHIARVYDYLLGGKDNFAADRAVAENPAEMVAALMRAARSPVRS